MVESITRWLAEGFRSAEQWDKVVAETDLTALSDVDLSRWYRKLNPEYDETSAANLAIIREIKRRGLVGVLDEEKRRSNDIAPPERADPDKKSVAKKPFLRDPVRIGLGGALLAVLVIKWWNS